MFEDVIRGLKDLERTGMKISIPIKPDDKGYIEKQCPNEECEYIFKVNNDDWADKFKDDSVYCPKCGHCAPADSYWTKAQLEHAKNEAYKQMKYRVSELFSKNATKFNRAQPKNSFITFSMKVTGKGIKPIIIPASAMDAFELEISCDQCHSRFSVQGASYFCPCCSHSNVLRVFNESMDKIAQSIKNLDDIKHALKKAGKNSEAENIEQILLESAMEDCVTAFQSFCNRYFEINYSSIVIPFNAFQKLDKTSALWHEATGIDFDEILSPNDQNKLSIYFQRRHILTHADGIVDDKYLARCNDKNYVAGQRIVVSRTDIAEFASIIKKLVTQLTA